MSKIEWTDRSDWNPIRGCTRVSEGCRNCYAESIAARFSAPGQPFHGFAKRTPNGPRWTGKVAPIEERLTLPLKWRRPARIFVNSAFDLFHESVLDEWIDRVFAVMALAPQHTFQVLTKRPKRMREWIKDRLEEGCWGAVEHRAKKIARGTPLEQKLVGKTLASVGPFSHVWLGVTAEDQARADERIPDLLATPAAVRFVSVEPMLGAIDLRRLKWGEPSAATFYGHPEINKVQFILDALTGAESLGWRGLDWIICGGESGPDARPMHPNWARDLRDQCGAAGVPFFFKQWGRWLPADQCNDRIIRCSKHAVVARSGRALIDHDIANPPESVFAFDYGKRHTGRLLDGVEHNAFPEPRQ